LAESHLEAVGDRSSGLADWQHAVVEFERVSFEALDFREFYGNEPDVDGNSDRTVSSGPAPVPRSIAGMTLEELDARPVPGKWSTKQVICHIADFEPVYLDRIKRVIAENEPTMFGGDPDLFAAGWLTTAAMSSWS
jgi:hypothetical protein